MTGRQWKPGDIAIVRFDDPDRRGEFVGVRGEYPRWWGAAGEFVQYEEIAAVRVLSEGVAS